MSIHLTRTNAKNVFRFTWAAIEGPKRRMRRTAQIRTTRSLWVIAAVVLKGLRAALAITKLTMLKNQKKMLQTLSTIPNLSQTLRRRFSGINSGRSTLATKQQEILQSRLDLVAQLISAVL